MPRKICALSRHKDPRPLIERELCEPLSEAKGRARSRTVTVNLAESPLSWLYARGFLSDRQLLAGETLRADYTAAVMEPRVTMRWDAVPSGRSLRGAPEGLTPSERMLSLIHI